MGKRAKPPTALSISPASHVDCVHLDPERWRHGLDGAELADPARIGGIAKNSSSFHARRDLLEQFQPFPAQTVFESHEAGYVAARLGQAVDKAGADRISNVHEHDRHAPARLLQRRHAQGAADQDHVWRPRDQFRRVFALAVNIILAPANVDARVAADSPARFLQPLHERRKARLPFGIVRSAIHEHADAPHAVRLPRAGSDRPGDR